MLGLKPAYLRDYKTRKAVIDAWKKGKDFLISDSFHPDFNRYCNKQDVLGQVKIRFNKLRDFVVIDSYEKGIEN